MVPGGNPESRLLKVFYIRGIWGILNRWTGTVPFIWPAGKEFPLTRGAKIDKIELISLAEEILKDLRRNGKWDMAQPVR